MRQKRTSNVDIEPTERENLYAVPERVVYRMLNGENPLKVIREYRRLTIGEFARRAHITPGQLTAIESDQQELSDELRLAVASILQVDERTLVRLVISVPKSQSPPRRSPTLRNTHRRADTASAR